MLGRTEASLKETTALVPQVPTEVYTVDTTDEEGLRKVAASVGKWDVLVLAAGYMSTPSSIASANLAEWWQSFEVRS